MPSTSFIRSGLSPQSTSINVPIGHGPTFGAIAAQLYERKCAEKGLAVNQKYYDRLLEMDQASGQFVSITGQGILSPSLSVHHSPSHGSPVGAEYCLNLSNLSPDASFETALDLLLMSSSNDIASLDCSQMGLGDDHIEVIAHTVLRCPRIRRVDVSGNPGVGVRGGEQLLVLIEQRKARGSPLSGVNVLGTAVGRYIERRIRDALPRLGGVEGRGQNDVSASPGFEYRAATTESEATELTSRATPIVLSTFVFAHRVLGLLCWDPPLRSVTWLTLTLSLCLTGASVETIVLLLVLVIWHRRLVLSPPIEGPSVAVSQHVGLYRGFDSDGRRTSFHRLRDRISTEILTPLRSSDGSELRIGLRNAIELCIAFTQRWGWPGDRELAGCLFVAAGVGFFIPLRVCIASLVVGMFAWAPFWQYAPESWAEGTSKALGSCKAWLKLERQGLMTGLEGEPLVQPVQSHPTRNPAGRPLDNTTFPFVFSIVSLRPAQEVPNKSGEEMVSSIAISVGSQSWLSPQIVIGSTPTEILHTSVPFQMPESEIGGVPVTFTLMSNSLVAGHSFEQLVAVARGSVLIPTCEMSELKRSRRRAGFIPIRVRLDPVKQPPNLVKSLLDSVFAHEDTDRQRFNLSMANGGIMGIEADPLVNGVNGRGDGVPTMYLFARLMWPEEGRIITHQPTPPAVHPPVGLNETPRPRTGKAAAPDLTYYSHGCDSIPSTAGNTPRSLESRRPRVERTREPSGKN